MYAINGINVASAIAIIHVLWGCSMATDLQTFKKNKDFLVCIDSDGCAIDSMNIKHINCFGPEMIGEWGLDEWRGEILDRWNEINLYSLTRGINRFKGLLMALCEIDENTLE